MFRIQFSMCACTEQGTVAEADKVIILPLRRPPVFGHPDVRRSAKAAKVTGEQGGEEEEFRSVPRRPLSHLPT